jgi:hypothetical protein
MAPKKKPAAAGPNPTLSGFMKSADEVYAKVSARRGTRAPLDSALAAACDAVKGKLTFIARAYVDEALVIVLNALSDDPLGFRPLAPRVMEACQLLERFGAAVRTRRTCRRSTIGSRCPTANKSNTCWLSATSMVGRPISEESLS